ncbi:hypothetical protein ACFJIV_19145 [Mucilaginibacter sp. UC70_90]
MKIIKLIPCLLLFISSRIFAQDQANITINLHDKIGDMYPFWAWFGHDEPNYTYMKDGRKLLSELAALSPVPVRMRVHNLLTSGDGTAALKWGSTNAYTEDANGNPVYNWRLVDSIFDTYIKLGMKPYAQIGLCPRLCQLIPNHIAITGNPAITMMMFTQDGPTLPKIIISGKSLFING